MKITKARLKEIIQEELIREEYDPIPDDPIPTSDDLKIIRQAAYALSELQQRELFTDLDDLNLLGLMQELLQDKLEV